jgi:hypothetical protein
MLMTTYFIVSFVTLMFGMSGLLRYRIAIAAFIIPWIVYRQWSGLSYSTASVLTIINALFGFISHYAASRILPLQDVAACWLINECVQRGEKGS